MAWEESGGCLLTGWVVSGVEGGVTLYQALLGNVGTCRLDVKGEVQVVSATRASVPMPGTGAEQPVLVMKRSNVRGAKGLRRSVLGVGQPVRGGTYG